LRSFPILIINTNGYNSLKIINPLSILTVVIIRCVINSRRELLWQFAPFHSNSVNYVVHKTGSRSELSRGRSAVVNDAITDE
jgi:hypothetical protein